jgi:hypothetical protein
MAKQRPARRMWVYTGKVPIEPAKRVDKVLQFKISLLEVKPAVWRRIQVVEGTLDELHEHIQSAMGWTNSHLHQFRDKMKRYANPNQMHEDMEVYGLIDTTTTMMSDVFRRAKTKMIYEYDFGDGWAHEVLFEGKFPAEPRSRYPVCLDGANACPPEDCGGPWGYAHLLEALSDKKHPEHAAMKEWIGGKFDAKKFTSQSATRSMRQGLPYPLL